MSRWWRLLYHSPLLSPRGLLLRALVVLAVFIALHLAGLREYTSIFSGTSPTDTIPGAGDRALGLIYALFYLLAVVAVPVTVIAAALLFLAVLMIQRRSSQGGR
jgi:TRAP-type C4-dicarboxylate transport system permease small subunit